MYGQSGFNSAAIRAIPSGVAFGQAVCYVVQADTPWVVTEFFLFFWNMAKKYLCI